MVVGGCWCRESSKGDTDMIKTEGRWQVARYQLDTTLRKTKPSTTQVVQNKYNTRTMHSVFSTSMMEGNIRGPWPPAYLLHPASFCFLAFASGWCGWVTAIDDWWWATTYIMNQKQQRKEAGTSEQRSGGREPRAIRGRGAKRAEVTERGKLIIKHLLVNHQLSKDQCLSYCSHFPPIIISLHITQESFLWPLKLELG